MFGRRNDRAEWEPHPLYQTASSDRSDAPTCAVGEELLRTILDAEIGSNIVLAAHLLEQVFYEGESLGSFTGETEADQAWVITGSDVMGVLVSLGVVSATVDETSYVKAAVGFGALVKGPQTWTRALGEWVCDHLE